MIAAALLFLSLQQNVDEKEAKAMLSQFNKSYNTAREDHGKREGAVNALSQRQHPLLLDRLIEVGRIEKTMKVRAAAAEGLGEYAKSEKAAEALVSWLRKDQLKDEFYVVDQRCLISIGMLDSEVSRKIVDKVNDWFDFREAGVAKAAVMAAGKIRHASSIEPLMEEMKRNQREMLKFITGEKVDGCDGG